MRETYLKYIEEFLKTATEAQLGRLLIVIWHGM